MKWKKDYWSYLVVILIVGAIVLSQTTDVFQTVIGEDGYILLSDSSTTITDGWSCTTDGTTCEGTITCNSKYYESIQTLKAPSSYFACNALPLTASNTIMVGSDQDLTITAGQGTLRLKQDLTNKYFRTTFRSPPNEGSYGNCNTCGHSSSSVNLVSDNGKSYQIIGGTKTYTAGIELIPSVLQSNILVVMLNGEKVKELDISEWEGLYLQINFNEVSSGAGWELIKPRYQYLFSCQKESYEMLGVMTYSGGQSVSLSPDGSLTSISEPVLKFCPTHAAILTDQSEGGSTETTEYYYELAKGNAVTVQDDQTLTFFFIFDTSRMAVSCSDAEAYDFNSKTCKEISGIATFLREGTVDEESGVVIVNPEIVCQINKVPEGIYYIGQDGCIIYKEDDVDCNIAGYVYQASTNSCVNPTGTSVPAAESVEVIKEVTESDCQAQYGETASVLTGSDGKAYACYVKEIQNTYFCNGVVMNEGDVCEVNNAGDVTGISLVTQDESVGLQEFNYTLLYVILALVIGIMVLFILTQKKRR